MRFVHRHIHRNRYFDAVVARAHANVPELEPEEIVRPHCGLRSFMDGEPPADPWEHEDLENRAAAWLDGEYPDHGHRFGLDP